MCIFFNDSATPAIYTLSLHDALPISFAARASRRRAAGSSVRWPATTSTAGRWLFARTAYLSRGQGFILGFSLRSEEHTSELQSQSNLVCRLLLEKKKRMRPKTKRER